MTWRDEDDWTDEDSGDWPSEAGEEEFLTVECPNCEAEIHDDTPRCPFCGEYITASAKTSWKHKPVWFIWLALLGIIAVMLAMLFPW